jgi:hypothetical protein
LRQRAGKGDVEPLARGIGGSLTAWVSDGAASTFATFGEISAGIDSDSGGRVDTRRAT